MSGSALPGSATLGAPRASEAVAARFVRWATLAVAVGLWELVCRRMRVAHEYLAAPSVIVTKGMPDVLSADSLQLLWQTTERFLIAFVIVMVVGPLLGLALGRVHRPVFLGARDVVSVLYALPLVPFYPLFVLWLGLGDRSEIAFGAIHGIVPVVLLTMSASADVPRPLLDASTAMGARRVARLRSVVLPAVVPDVIGALKIGAALTLLGVLLAELMISVNGVGTYIAAQITNQSAAKLDAMVLVVCVGAVVINAMLSALERRVSRWRTSLA